MTHPLTPREKVELRPCPMCGITDSTDNPTQQSGLVIQVFKSVAGGDACRVLCVCGTSGPSAREDWQAAAKWNRRAALASSGDHAELARLADDLRKFEHHAVGSLKIGMDEVRRIIAACDAHAALLAENAALREKVRTEIRLSVDNYVRAAARATEAERKLAEAEGRGSDGMDRLAFAVQLLRDYVELTHGGHDVSALNSETRTFLSKEAERG